ncbi:MAG: hypothetical protein JKY56_26910 [Kofleriaceae bacterium]|nr:hypothetical protein [Kofleriaceae bacterium]
MHALPHNMIKKSSLFVSLLMALSAAACTVEAPVEELSKDDVRAMPIDDKADHIDWCEVFNWYDDGVCDEFCASPDPDCFVTCETSDCPIPPEFSPRPCDNGTFVFGSAECVADQESRTCGLQFDAPDCPEDRICETSECPEPPNFSPRPCENGTFVFGTAECVADQDGDCGLEFDAPDCPEDRVCGIDECGPIPNFSPRPCDDGSFVFASAECVADLNGDCGLEIDGGSCPEDSE